MTPDTAGRSAVRVEVVTTPVVPSRPELLDTHDLRRWTDLRFAADRDRLFTGVMLRRAVLQQKARRPVPLQRRCRGCGAQDHGEVQPAEPGDRSRWRISMSHAGPTVVLAVADTLGAQIGIGVDVEAVSRLEPGMAKFFLSDSECARLVDPGRSLLCSIWTAKEAALKALGYGLHASMSDLEVTSSSAAAAARVRPVGDDPRLRPLADGPSRLIDITALVRADHDPPGRQRAALLLIGTEDVVVTRRRLGIEQLMDIVQAAGPGGRAVRTNAHELIRTGGQ